MVSTDGLMPITRAFLSSYYDKYQFPPLSDDVSRLSDQIRAMSADLLHDSPATQGFHSFLFPLFLLLGFLLDRRFIVCLMYREA